jgi:hypothetical protein
LRREFVLKRDVQIHGSLVLKSGSKPGNWAQSPASVYLGLGEVDQALQWLEKGVEQRDVIVVSGLKSEPIQILLHGHPRYRALLRKMNLEP